MAAGTWSTANKVRPGVYINFETEPKPLGGVADRGITTIPVVLPWGSSKNVITVEAGEDVYTKLGYSLTSPELLLIREALKRAKKALIYRVNTGTQATAMIGDLTVTALHGGIRGNDIIVVVEKNIDDEQKYDITTIIAGTVADTQTVASIAELIDNDWVTFSGTEEAALQESAGIRLSGGANGTVTNQDYLDYLSAIETHSFDTIALPVTDPTLKSVFVSFVKRMREDEGKKVQCVLENYPLADYEGVISVKNGVVLADGTELTPVQATAWVAGATAGANVDQSLTYQTYDDAVDVIPRYTNTQIIEALQAGELVFTTNDSKVIVEQDINTLTSFTPSHGKAFSKNRVVRVLDNINNSFVQIFSDFYIGKINNDEDGHNLLKGECIHYMETLQSMNAIQNFDPQTDLIILPGNDADSVFCTVYVQPTDSVEKLYFKVQVR